MATLIAERLALRRLSGFFGRAAELRALNGLLDPDGPLVLHLHGLGGVGKTRLLDAFARQAHACGAAVIQLDCRAIEPTEAGFLRAIGQALGAATPDIAAVAAALAGMGGPVILALDAYESFRLLDAWLRQIFIPPLSDQARVLLAGREPPVPAWALAPGWRGLFRPLALAPLAPAEALDLLAHAGVHGPEAQRIQRFVGGHPLALELAASALVEHPGLAFEQLAAPRAIEQLDIAMLHSVRYIGRPARDRAAHPALPGRRTRPPGPPGAPGRRRGPPGDSPAAGRAAARSAAPRVVRAAARATLCAKRK
jgi:AAA ATPase domain